MARMDPLAEDIGRLDFKDVRANLTNREGWTVARCERAERDYRRFLLLAAAHRGTTIVPWCEDLDTFWCYHILDTRAYARDCDNAIGFFLHHNPNLAVGTAPHREASTATYGLHKRTFGRSPGHTGREPYPTSASDCGSWFDFSTMVPDGHGQAHHADHASHDDGSADAGDAGGGDGGSCGGCGGD